MYRYKSSARCYIDGYFILVYYHTTLTTLYLLLQYFYFTLQKFFTFRLTEYSHSLLSTIDILYFYIARRNSRQHSTTTCLHTVAGIYDIVTFRLKYTNYRYFLYFYLTEDSLNLLPTSHSEFYFTLTEDSVRFG